MLSCLLLDLAQHRLALIVPPALGMVVAGTIVGFGYYFCISAKSTAVGFDVVALILNKKNPKINITLSMYLINMCVLLFGLFTYGMLSVLTGIGLLRFSPDTESPFKKRKGNGRPFSNLTVSPDLNIVYNRSMLDDRKPKPGSPCLLGVAFITR